LNLISKVIQLQYNKKDNCNYGEKQSRNQLESNKMIAWEKFNEIKNQENNLGNEDTI
jgi:hypothetical protein